MPGLSELTEPLRRLVKKEPFVVDNDFQNVFNDIKAAVASRILKLAYFDVSGDRDTCITADASPTGLGSVLWQKHKEHWMPVSCASRSLSAVEQRYSQLEREMLAVVFGLTKFRQYILGRRVTVFTDPKMLVSIVKKASDEVPIRVQRWLLALMPYDYSLVYAPGTTMVMTDALSRAPRPSSESAPEESRSLKEFVGLLLEEAPVTSGDLKNATDNDVLLSHIRQPVLSDSWSRRTSVEEEAYFKARNYLTVIEGLLMLDNRFVVPAVLRQRVFQHVSRTEK